MGILALIFLPILHREMKNYKPILNIIIASVCCGIFCSILWRDYENDVILKDDQLVEVIGTYKSLVFITEKTGRLLSGPTKKNVRNELRLEEYSAIFTITTTLMPQDLLAETLKKIERTSEKRLKIKIPSDYSQNVYLTKKIPTYSLTITDPDDNSEESVFFLTLNKQEFWHRNKAIAVLGALCIFMVISFFNIKRIITKRSI